MQRAVEEGIEAGHPPELDEAVPPGELPQRRERERDAHKTKCPDTGFIGHVGEWVGTQVPGRRRPPEVDERRKRRHEDRRLEREPEGTIGQLHVRSSASGPCPRRGWPP